MKGVRLILLSALVVSIFLAGTAAAAVAEPFSIVTSPSGSITTYVGDVLDLNMSVTNNIGRDATVKIYASVSFKDWLPAGRLYMKDVKADNTEVFSIQLVPPSELSSGNYAPFVRICERDTDTCVNEYVYMHVVNKQQLVFESFSTIKEEYRLDEAVRVSYILNNTGTSDISGYKLRVALLRNGSTTAEVRVDLPDVKKSGTYSSFVSFDIYEKIPGNYTVLAEIYDDAGEVMTDESRNISVLGPAEGLGAFQTTTVTPGFFGGILSKKFSVTRKNELLEPSTVTVREPVFASRFVYTFYRAQPSIVDVSGKKMFSWQCDLQPRGIEGDSCTIEYRINYWMLYLAGLVVLGMAVLAYTELQKPHIKKRHARKKNKFRIHIDLKNRGSRPLRNVTVVESVPSVMRLLGQYSIKPSSVRVKKDKIEVTWRIGTLKPGEERVLSYSMKPRLAVEGGLRLPPVRIKATNHKGETVEAESGRSVVS